MEDSEDTPKRKKGEWRPQGDIEFRPLSDAEALIEILPSGEAIRVDATGRRLCSAKRRDGKPCVGPAVSGTKVCRMHGGSTPLAKKSAKLRLAELVDPAVATLAREMTQADKSADRQRAANSILDRTGYGRQSTLEMVELKEQLIQRLLRLRADEEPEED